MANCLNCGKEVAQTPGRRPRQYCDDNCRQKKWQADHKKVTPPSDTEIKAAAAAKNRKAEEKEAQAEKKIDPPPGLTGIDLTIWKAEQKAKQKS